MGTGIALLSTARTTFFGFAFVGLLALGMAFIAPNLPALISKRGGEQPGTALGVQNAANSLGYVGEDGKSKMPDYNSVLTVKQVADLADEAVGALQR